jgi:ribonuclease HI
MSRSELKKVTIYTDGGCSPNPGKGGYGVILLYGEHRKELSGGYRRTTNNRMEILAAIVGLRALTERCEVTLFSDSQYLVRAIEKGWVRRWKRNGWMRTKTDRALNVDLWEELLELLERHSVSFQWVRGHASNRHNNRCDELAGMARRKGPLKEDHGYRS